MDRGILKLIFPKVIILAVIFVFFAFSISFFGVAFKFFPAALVLPAGAGTIDTTNRYAYSENAGWIDFGSAQGLVGVGNTELTGYAWGENIGWISLNCSNDDTCATTGYKVANGSGLLSGYAYGENVGWINFNPLFATPVQIDSTGAFSGYAWGENTGWISFNCSNTSTCGTVNYKVVTTWRNPEHGTGGSLGSEEDPILHPEELLEGPEAEPSVVINGGAITTDNRQVVLTLKPEPDEPTVGGIAISEDPTFRNYVVQPFETTKNFTLSEGIGPKTVYVRFFYQTGTLYDVDYSSIVLLEKETPVEPEPPVVPVTPPPTKPVTPKPPTGAQPPSPPPTGPQEPTAPLPNEGEFFQIISDLISVIEDFFRHLFGR